MYVHRYRYESIENTGEQTKDAEMGNTETEREHKQPENGRGNVKQGKSEASLSKGKITGFVGRGRERGFYEL
jgi:hypothetical protein